MHLTYKSSFSPARRDSFRTQHHFYSIPKPPNSSSRLSLISFTHLLRLRSPGLPLLSSSVWFPPTVLGEMLCNALTFLERCYGLRNPSPALSIFTAHQTAFPRQNDFFCREVKRDASAEGISVERLVLQGLSRPSALALLSSVCLS